MTDFLFPKLHKEGYRFVAIALILSFILLLISNTLGLLSFIITTWVYYFFRDPERYSINNEDYLLSPADGVFGFGTEKALMNLQWERGLAPDGIAGPITLGKQLG